MALQLLIRAEASPNGTSAGNRLAIDSQFVGGLDVEELHREEGVRSHDELAPRILVVASTAAVAAPQVPHLEATEVRSGTVSMLFQRRTHKL